jgi:hypothetical protein
MPDGTFKPDGCSLSPDWDFVECCNIHDRAYAKIDSSAIGWLDNFKARRGADKALLKCIREHGKAHHYILGPLYYAGVRCFGWLFWTYRNNDKARE